MKSDQMFGLSLTNVLMLGDIEDQKTHQRFMITHGKKSQLNKKNKKEFNLRKDKNLKRQSWRLLLIKKLLKKHKLLKSTKQNLREKDKKNWELTDIKMPWKLLLKKKKPKLKKKLKQLKLKQAKMLPLLPINLLQPKRVSFKY